MVAAPEKVLINVITNLQSISSEILPSKTPLWLRLNMDGDIERAEPDPAVRSSLRERAASVALGVLVFCFIGGATLAWVVFLGRVVRRLF
jgi:hypothetical protein